MTHRLSVNVVDTAGQPQSGVVVAVGVRSLAGGPAAVVTADALVLGTERQVTTDGRGVAKFLLLPLPAPYTLTLQGHPPVTFTMPPEDVTLAEAVEATA